MSAVSDTVKTAPRIIEREMPLAAISAQSAREKSIRHGHLSTLHIWWARRPLAACRAAIFAALVPEPDDPVEAKRMQAFIAQLSNWDNSIDSVTGVSDSTHTYIAQAREMIKNAFPNRAPRVLDPFAGGGAIPLEALRLGCETHALDLNPVAHIIQLATLVYPQKFANRPGPYGEKPGATLAGDVRSWGKWVLEKARAEIGDLYPKDEDGAATVAYLWARAVTCPNLGCGSAVPLIRQTWLSRKPKKYVAYKVEANGPGSNVRFQVMPTQNLSEFEDFDPSVGTSRGGAATCPCCGTPLSDKYITSESVAGNLGALPVAVVTDTPGMQGKRYRDVSAADALAYSHAMNRLTEAQEKYDPFSGDLAPVPDEMIAQRRITGGSCVVYGMDSFGKLFNARQALAITTLVRAVREAYTAILAETSDTEYAKAVGTYLAFAVDRLTDRCAVLCRWDNSRETIVNVFGRQGLPMVWDYAEVNPFSPSTGGWTGAIEWITKYIEHGAATADSSSHVTRGTATQLPYPDGYFDAVITDHRDC